MTERAMSVSDRKTKIGILGLGYVGIPLAQRISEAGFQVLGLDVDEERVLRLNNGASPIRHIPDAAIAGMRRRGFEATRDFPRAAECDALIICVPTPLNKYREPDLSFVTATMDSIAPHLRAGQILSLESTTWPGTTDEILLPYVTAAGLTPGKDFFLGCVDKKDSPARLAVIQDHLYVGGDLGTQSDVRRRMGIL